MHSFGGHFGGFGGGKVLKGTSYIAWNSKVNINWSISMRVQRSKKLSVLLVNIVACVNTDYGYQSTG